MLDKIKILIKQKADVSSQLCKEINKIKIDDLSSEELIEFFNIVFPTFESYDIYSPSELDELFHEMNFTYHDTFSMERHQTMDYDSLIDYIYGWMRITNGSLKIVFVLNDGQIRTICWKLRKNSK